MPEVKQTISLKDKVSERLKTIVKNLEQTQKSFEKTETSVKSFEKSLRISDIALGNVFGNVIAGLGKLIAQIPRMGIEFNAMMEGFTSDFTVMLGSLDKAEAKVQELQDIASKTPFEITDLADATKTLLAFGIEADKSTEVLKMLGDVALGNKQKFQSLALVYGQVQAAGKLTGGDLLQLINVGFNPLQIIAEKTGKTMGELRDLMSEGAISAEMVATAFKIATSEGGLFFGGMEAGSRTFMGVLSTLTDNVKQMLGTMFKPAFDMLKSLMQGVNTFVSWIMPAVQSVSDFITKHAEGIKTVIGILGIVAVSVGVAWFIAWLPVNLVTLLIVGGIALLTIGVIKLAQWFADMGLTFGSVVGAMAGGVAWFGTIFYNIWQGVKAVFDLVSTLMYNGWALFVNSLVDNFGEGVATTLEVLDSFGQSALWVLGKIADMIDFIFGSNLSDTVTKWSGQLYEWTSGLASEIRGGTFKMDYKELPEMPEMLDPNQVFQNVRDQVKGFFDGKKQGGEGADLGTGGEPFDFGGAFDSLDGGLKDINDKLGGKGSLKSVGETTIKEDNLKYLRDIALERYKMGYQTSNPVINFSLSTGDINSGADENALYNKIENILINALRENLT